MLSEDSGFVKTLFTAAATARRNNRASPRVCRSLWIYWLRVFLAENRVLFFHEPRRGSPGVTRSAVSAGWGPRRGVLPDAPRSRPNRKAGLIFRCAGGGLRTSWRRRQTIIALTGSSSSAAERRGSSLSPVLATA